MMQPLSIEPSASLGLPFLQFASGCSNRTSHAEIYAMFESLPPEQRRMLEQSQTMLPDGRHLMANMLHIIRQTPDRELCIEYFYMTPDAVEFLAVHGEPFVGEKLPHEILMEPRWCMKNSLVMCAKRPGLAYVEGLALPSVGFPMHHAWCTDNRLAFDAFGIKRRRAQDYTWARADYARYFGIPLSESAFSEITQIIQAVCGYEANHASGFLRHELWCKEIATVLEHDYQNWLSI